MAYARYGQHDKSFICDGIEDLKNLPFATIGSTCYVIENASKYMVNSKGEWIRQTYGDMINPEGGNIDLTKYATIDYVNNEINKISNNTDANFDEIHKKIDNLETETNTKIEKIKEEINLDDAIFDSGII